MPATRIVTLLCNVAPQRLAAYWNALRRCWPSVVPEFPPTGARAVGSLKPTPAASLFTMVKVAACAVAPSQHGGKDHGNPAHAPAIPSLPHRAMASAGAFPFGSQSTATVPSGLSVAVLPLKAPLQVDHLSAARRRDDGQTLRRGTPRSLLSGLVGVA